ncbi:hypothetical protein ACJJTC_019480 [Scirpophaga incertulas]
MSYINFENVGAFLRKCNGTTLRYDQACLEILTKEKISFWSQYEECEGCMLLETANLPATGSVILDTLSPVEYAIRNGNGEICNGTFAFREFGQYSINLTAGDKGPMPTHDDSRARCSIPSNPHRCGHSTLHGYHLVHSERDRKEDCRGETILQGFLQEDDELGSGPRILTQEVASAFTQTRSRLRSLDIFRGLCIALMIFVNAGGGGYGIFSHSVWNGLTVADVVYPWFAFAMGEALVLSLNARLRASLPRSAALCQVCVTLTVAAPGCPAGYMGPGGLHMSKYNVNLQNCTGGIAGYVDRLILGPSHLHKRGSFSAMYATSVPHDPEGLMGILSGVLVVQAGAHATRIMLSYNHARARILRWLFWSIVFGITGGALCDFSKNGGPIPVNKNLWSLSYCLVTAGMAFFLQAVLYFVVDLKTKWGGRPLYYAGEWRG